MLLKGLSALPGTQINIKNLWSWFHTGDMVTFYLHHVISCNPITFSFLRHWSQSASFDQSSIRLSSWQPGGPLPSGSDAEVSVQFQPVPFLLVQQEVIDIGEEFVRGHGADEPLAVHPVFVQKQHTEVGPGDPEGLSAREWWHKK